jgi:hypothetical protein
MIGKRDEHVLMWDQYIAESPWLNHPIPDKFTQQMESLDVDKIMEFPKMENCNGLDIYEHTEEDNTTSLYLIKSGKLAAYYKFVQLPSSIQSKMTWNSPSSTGSFIDMFANYIIPKYKIVESDDMLTPKAFELWKKMIGAYTEYKYYAKVDDKLFPMTNPYDVYSYEERFNPSGNSTFIAAVNPSNTIS